MRIETNADLTPYNTFGLPAVAPTLIHVRSEADLMDIIHHPEYGPSVKYILGGGSNVVFSGTMPAVILKVEISGRRLVRENQHQWVVEAGAGENWHDLVGWTLTNGWPGLENLALIPGTAGAAPVQNIGAYGVEIKDRFESLDAVDLKTGRMCCLSTVQCRFGYRDSVLKNELGGRCLITRVRFSLPRPWRPALDYPDLKRRLSPLQEEAPHPHQVYEWVCDLRRAKLPDPAALPNAGSFFKNPIVDHSRFADVFDRAPDIVHFPLPDGRIKLSAAWMIDRCGWKGKRRGRVGVFDRQALVLVNHGGASARELLELAGAIQDSVFDRFGIRLEIEPTVI